MANKNTELHQAKKAKKDPKTRKILMKIIEQRNKIMT